MDKDDESQSDAEKTITVAEAAERAWEKYKPKLPDYCLENMKARLAKRINEMAYEFTDVDQVNGFIRGYVEANLEQMDEAYLKNQNERGK